MARACHPDTHVSTNSATDALDLMDQGLRTGGTEHLNMEHLLDHLGNKDKPELRDTWVLQ